MRAAIIAGTILLAFTAGSTGASAQSVEFNLTGTIQEPTCDWSLGSDERKVLLAPIGSKELPASGAARFTDFSLSLEKCSSSTTQARFTFTGTSEPKAPPRFQNTGDATGVAVELQSADGTTVGANGVGNVRTQAVTGGAAELKLRAGYWRILGEPVVAGSVAAVAAVTVEYL
ncbi:fimbrial protein [Pinirhizobacter soli]|uniref:fimbrial protein n=1 Tax=Pinirhizobacter soli TaxID=2786953 RepID=UPI00202A475C